jgi:hypothetical protein
MPQRFDTRSVHPVVLERCTVWALSSLRVGKIAQGWQDHIPHRSYLFLYVKMDNGAAQNIFLI